jgi:hypothetical protein
MLDLVGMVENNEFKLRSNLRIPGNSLIYLFSGKLENKKLHGSIYLGEYLNASFTGSRIKYSNKKKKITIPGGPPLAT